MWTFSKTFWNIIIIAVLLTATTVYAINTPDTGFRVNKGTTTLIDAHSPCKNVTNSSGVVDYFVPTKTSNEWLAFLNADLNLTDISLTDCAPTGTPLFKVESQGEWIVDNREFRFDKLVITGTSYSPAGFQYWIRNDGTGGTITGAFAPPAPFSCTSISGFSGAVVSSGGGVCNYSLPAGGAAFVFLTFNPTVSQSYTVTSPFTSDTTPSITATLIGRALPSGWIDMGQPPSGKGLRIHPVLFSIGKGVLYMGGGASGGGINYNDFWKYDALLNVWTSQANLPMSGGAETFTIGTKGYLIENSTKKMWEFQEGVGWTAKATIPSSDFAVVDSTSFNGKGYVMTSQSSSSVPARIWSYNPTSNIWTEEASNAGFSGYYEVHSLFATNNLYALAANFTYRANFSGGSITSWSQVNNNNAVNRQAGNSILGRVTGGLRSTTYPNPQETWAKNTSDIWSMVDNGAGTTPFWKAAEAWGVGRLLVFAGNPHSGIWVLNKDI